MKLSELLKNVKVIANQGNIDIEIKDVNIDSRKIENGHLFIAMKGTQVDGHKFISKAIELGEIQGSMSGLAIIVTGLFTVGLAPIIYMIVSKIFY